MQPTGSERLMSQNGRRPLVIEMPNYKQRRVFAVRDFPPGCGPNAPKADIRGNGAVCYNDNVQNNEHSAGDCLEVENKKTSSAAESHALLHDVDKSVHAVQKAGELELLKEEHTVSDFPEVENMKPSAAAAESPALLQAVDKSVHVALKAIELELMNDDSFDGLENLSKSLEPTEMSEGSLPRSCYLSETLQENIESVAKELLRETQEPLKDAMEDQLRIPGVLSKGDKKISAHEEEMVFSAVVPSASVRKEKNNLPRRRVSVIRDFPPGCGTHILANKKHMQVQPPKSSEELYKMTDPKSKKCVKIEKLRVAYDRKMEKGASEGRDGREVTLHAKRKVSSDHAKGIGIQKGLMGAVNCPRQQEIATSSCVDAKDNRCEKGIAGKKLKLKSRFLEAIMDTEEIKEGVVPGKLLRMDDKTPAANDRRQKHPSSMAQSHQVDVSLPPIGASILIDGLACNKVRETLRLFQAVVRKLLQGAETNPKEQRQFRRVDLQASMILKEKGKYCNAVKPIIGDIPGVEVGDEFHYRVELMIIGLHRPPQAGIDSECDWALATSVVDSGGYDNKADDYDVWIYTGQGGNLTSRDKEPEDQKLERGNLALKNSMLKKNPVRVIRGVKDTKPSEEDVRFPQHTLIMGCILWKDIGQRSGNMVKKSISLS